MEVISEKKSVNEIPVCNNFQCGNNCNFEN